MGSIRINSSGLPPVQVSEQQPTAVESTQQTQVASNVANQPSTSEASGESRSINGGTQMAEAFLAGNLLASKLQAQLAETVHQEAENPAAGSAEVQQSVPIFSEAQMIGLVNRPTLPSGEVQQSEAIAPGEASSFLGGVRLELNSGTFGITPEGNVTINDEQLAERLKANLKKTE